MAYQFLEQNLNFFSSRHVRPLFRNLPKHSTALRIKSNIPSMGCKVWQKVAPADNSPHHRGRSPTGHHACSLRLVLPPKRLTWLSLSLPLSLGQMLPIKESSMSSMSNQQPYILTHTHTHCLITALFLHCTHHILHICLLLSVSS